MCNNMIYPILRLFIKKLKIPRIRNVFGAFKGKGVIAFLRRFDHFGV